MVRVHLLQYLRPVHVMNTGGLCDDDMLAIMCGCRATLESAGPAFIKWGQWAATRHDLFPPDFCTALEQLHTQACTDFIIHMSEALVIGKSKMVCVRRVRAQ